jgi:hypothetical protein
MWEAICEGICEFVGEILTETVLAVFFSKKEQETDSKSEEPESVEE